MEKLKANSPPTIRLAAINGIVILQNVFQADAHAVQLVFQFQHVQRIARRPPDLIHQFGNVHNDLPDSFLWL